MKTEKPITSKKPQVKCPYCKAVNTWPNGKDCKHCSGHEMNMRTGEHTFFFVK